MLVTRNEYFKKKCIGTKNFGENREIQVNLKLKFGSLFAIITVLIPDLHSCVLGTMGKPIN